MSKRYIPRIREAAIPEDGGWMKLQEEGAPVLVLSVPEWSDELKQSVSGYEHTWMYDRANDAYLFCFRLEEGREYAIAFAREHAGILLNDDRARGKFSLLVTAQHLKETEDLKPCFLFRGISLKRHPRAGW
ncbi:MULTISPECIES: hypothetical protein [Thermoactinomyces]|uniref:Uncharacterized protein n=1 Tax=Thermoactinomyces daqus TaxID=1329516 RepID=A0A7W2AIW2_9BACL|nr:MULTISPECIES: hypothetical protein [Thermoactinomyces]MBA4543313.1 hypothetical protein [Thermoactinomyces daqus]MBH8598454.1 hypothetical protein [Thermoactinomyces sp. CICC 10523]MBH8604701.1 hypothetical protein [Thermoactinomyces sp. CICC 10522]MBH8606838.1 hypothetical protein [Thermoactinomyces sp. CICC 10521]